MAQMFAALFRYKIDNVRNGLDSSLISGREGVVSDTGEVIVVVFDSF